MRDGEGSRALERFGRFWLAPLAGITDLPFRVIARKRGAELVFTEMLSANALVRQNRRTLDMLASSPEQGMWGAQLVGAEPDIMAEAAKLVERAGAHLIDINMGCPVRKVVRKGAGAALMKNPALAARIIASVRRATNLPLSVKVRAGWRSPEATAVELATVAREEGADILAVHPRFADENYSVPARWELIREVKERVGMFVAGSGDVFDAHAAVRMLRETGCDAVLIARGALGNPWVFRAARLLWEGKELPPEPSPQERLETFMEQLAIARRLWPDEVIVHRLKKHLMWYSAGLAGSKEFRKMVSRCADLNRLVELAEQFFTSSGDSGERAKEPIGNDS